MACETAQPLATLGQHAKEPAPDIACRASDQDQTARWHDHECVLFNREIASFSTPAKVTHARYGMSSAAAIGS